MTSAAPLFWRDPAHPYVELRQVLDGRNVTYSPHFHNEWSVGAILTGNSEFVCADRLYTVKRGTLVMMNPHVVHACNPLKHSPWGYYMMHIDTVWLASLLKKIGVRQYEHWQDTQLDTLSVPSLYVSFVNTCNDLISEAYSTQQKSHKLESCLTSLVKYIDKNKVERSTVKPLSKVYKIAQYLNEHCLDNTSISEISSKFGLSVGYFNRLFKQSFNMTPHAYRLNCRLHLSQHALKSGDTIVDTAHTMGFSDQAHFQRVFKERVAATPNQYRRNL